MPKLVMEYKPAREEIYLMPEEKTGRSTVGATGISA
jgi:hypothetical protein